MLSCATNLRKLKTFSSKYSDVEFIVVINANIHNIYEQDKFHAQLS